MKTEHDNDNLPRTGLLNEAQAKTFMNEIIKCSALLSKVRIVCLICGRRVIELSSDRWQFVRECGCGVYRWDATTCPECGGDGVGSDEDEMRCDACRGDGVIWIKTLVGTFHGDTGVMRDERIELPITFGARIRDRER